MTRILLVGDIHAMSKPPASVNDYYMQDILDMLEHIAEMEKTMDIDAVVWAGDVFNFPNPQRTSHALVMDMITAAQKFRNLYIVAGNHDMCVSDDTEALTDKGWKTLNQLTGDEKFATRNRETGAIEFQAPEKIHRMDYSGDFYHFKNRETDLLTSPNHRWWTSTRADGTNPWSFRTSSELYGMKSRAVVPVGGELEARQALDNVYIGGRWVDAHLAARLIGWFLAEGTVDPQRVTISQSNLVNREHYLEIEALMENLGVSYTSSAKMIRLNDSNIAKFFMKNFGKATSKDVNIPQWLYEWPKELLLELLYAYFRGDGTIIGSVEKRVIADYTTASIHSRSANDGLISGLTAIAAMCGYVTSVSDVREFPFAGTKYAGHARTVGFLQGKQSKLLPKPELVSYTGEIWCPQLPNETWLARRNGKAVWTGNSNDRLESIDETQPLGVLFRAGAKRVEGSAGWADGGLPLYIVNWQQDWHNPEAVHFAFEEWRDSHPNTLKESLVVTHAPIYPPDQENQLFDLVPTHGEGSISEAMGNQGYVYYGHIHEDHGVFESDGVTYCNVGALSRGALHEYNVQREIQVALWDSKTGFEPIVIPHRPAEEVFKIAEVTEKKSEKLSLDQFLADVGSSTLDISSTESVVEHISKLNVAKPVKKLATDILREVS